MKSPSDHPASTLDPPSSTSREEDQQVDRRRGVNHQTPSGEEGSAGAQVEEDSDDDDDEADLDPESRTPDTSELGPLSARSIAALRHLARYGRRQRRSRLAETDADAEGTTTTARTGEAGRETATNKDDSTTTTTPPTLDFGDGWNDWPQHRRAAVMVALFGGRTGELNVLLSTRAMEMRVNPGEVALPGGKMEPTDLDLVYTARREAYEEIGLPMSTESVRHLCNLPPFLSRANPLLVTPVVCFLLDPTVKPTLNPSEVSNVFSHPLASFLTEQPPREHYVPYTVHNGTKPYRLQYDISWIHGSPYRLFRFEGRLNPIWGFTADILIQTAMLAYGRQPEFERKAPGQMHRKELVRAALEDLKKGKLPPKAPKLARRSASSTPERKPKL